MHIFNETFTNVFLLDSSPSINSASYTNFVIRRVNFKIYKTDDTFRGPSHELFIAQKKRCLYVNKQTNANDMFLPLLFTMKRSLSISLKSLVY